MLSHPGLVRAENEDSVLYCLPRAGSSARGFQLLAIVADGMGGHAAGEVASAMATRTLGTLCYDEQKPAAPALAGAFEAANQLIYEHSVTNPECSGMGTTCTAVVLRDGCAWLAHVGDSRAYIVRDGQIYQLSEDHSLVAELVRDGTMTREEAATSPERNVILQALGTKPAIEPQIFSDGLPVRAGDVIVLCSDGLTDLVEDATIQATVTTLPPFDACESLINAALAAGGHDNVSVGVFGVSQGPITPQNPDRPTRTIDVKALLGELK
jgi:PPM family protein phosphatase